MQYGLKKWGTVLGVSLILPACVTINIYFPAAAAEKAADKIIDEVWQIKKGQQTTPDKPAETTSTPVPDSTAPAAK